MVITLNIPKEKVVYLALLCQEECSRVLDKVDEYRSCGAHSIANERVREAEFWLDLASQVENYLED